MVEEEPLVGGVVVVVVVGVIVVIDDDVLLTPLRLIVEEFTSLPSSPMRLFTSPSCFATASPASFALSSFTSAGIVAAIVVSIEATRVPFAAVGAATSRDGVEIAPFNGVGATIGFSGGNNGMEKRSLALVGVVDEIVGVDALVALALSLLLAKSTGDADNDCSGDEGNCCFAPTDAPNCSISIDVGRGGDALVLFGVNAMMLSSRSEGHVGTGGSSGAAVTTVVDEDSSQIVVVVVGTIEDPISDKDGVSVLSMMTDR